MSRSRKSVLGAVLIAPLLLAVPGIASPPGGHPQGKHGTDQTVAEECDGGTVTYDGPETMWPPNHKYRDLTITAEADDSNDDVSLATEGFHDEVGMNGAGPSEDARPAVDPPADADTTVDDAERSGTAETEHSIRSTRSGRGDGRTYTIMYQAQFGDGEPCTGEFTIEVPHSQGASAENKKVHEPEEG